MAEMSVGLEPQVAQSAVIAVDERKRGSWLRAFVARNKVGTFFFILLLAIVILALFGPWMMPGENQTNVSLILSPPVKGHPLGTDYMGKDVLYQIFHGGRSLLIVAFLAALMSTVIAVVFGTIAAVVGGRTDVVITVITDVVLTVPGIVLLAVLAAYVTLNSPLLLAVIIAATSWTTLLRAIRAQVLSLKEREYVEAARMLDLGMGRIMFSEIIPNMMTYIVINFVIAMTGGIFAQIILYFLGLVPLTGDNWGLMIQQAYSKGALFYKDSLVYILSPIVMIVLLQLSLVMVSRSLEDIFNPRLREG